MHQNAVLYIRSSQLAWRDLPVIKDESGNSLKVIEVIHSFISMDALWQKVMETCAEVGRDGTTAVVSVYFEEKFQWSLMNIPLGEFYELSELVGLPLHFSGGA